MSARKTTKAKAEAETTDEVQAEEIKEEPAAVEAADEAKPVRKTRAKASKPKEESAAEAEPMAYIGPDIRYIAKRGTVYKNGLPEALSKKIEEIPAIKGLVVPVSKLSTAMQAVDREGTSLHTIYTEVAKKI